jgi:hypothetical protein
MGTEYWPAYDEPEPDSLPEPNFYYLDSTTYRNGYLVYDGPDGREHFAAPDDGICLLCGSRHWDTSEPDADSRAIYGDADDYASQEGC